MSWNVVSLAVIFPLSQSIGFGFKRRERALVEFGALLGLLLLLGSFVILCLLIF